MYEFQLVIDAGDFTPAAAMGPTRAPGGATILGRLTTTEEQYAEAIEFLTQAATEHKEREVRARIVWSRTEPTTLEATFGLEHLSGKGVWMLDKVIEITANGGEVPRDDTARLRVLNDEVTELHDNGML